MRGGAAADSQLEFIDASHAKIITSTQVQMEFMKHRQRVIIETIGNLKQPLDGLNTMPPVLVKAQPAEQIKKHVCIGFMGAVN